MVRFDYGGVLGAFLTKFEYSYSLPSKSPLKPILINFVRIYESLEVLPQNLTVLILLMKYKLLEVYMAKKKIEDENRKTFDDLTIKSWLVDEGKIKVGDSATKIMKGECETLEVKETYFGDPSNTWRIVITTDDKLHLLKTAKELK
jgi:hypothetical protein